MVLGCVFSFSFSVPVARRIGLGDYYFFKRHIIFSVASILITFLVANVSSHMARGSSFLLFYASLILLVLVPFFGFHTKGARRWLYIAGISIQPSEFAKPFFILFSAHFLDKFSRTAEPRTLLVPLLVCPAAILLIFRQPDVGTFLLLSLVLSVQILMTDFFRLRHCIYMLLIFLIMFAITYITFPHVSDRIANFLTGARDIGRAHYQVRESIMAYRNAGWLGRGFLEGKTKNHIPDIHTDFIFPAIAEEFGFAVALGIVLVYFYIAIRAMLKAKQRNSEYEFLAINGLIFLLVLQACINICVSLNLLPTKGITLPFLSYGGSSALGTALASGYLLVFTKKEFGVLARSENSS
jgi:cell division protein FtsW